MTFFLLLTVDFALLLFCLIALNPSSFHSFFPFLLQTPPCQLPSSFNYFPIYQNAALFKLDSNSNILHYLHCFCYNCILFLHHLSSRCSPSPAICRASHVASNSESCFLVHISHRLYSTASVFSFQIQPFITSLLSQYVT